VVAGSSKFKKQGKLNVGFNILLVCKLKLWFPAAFFLMGPEIVTIQGFAF
jgi:hypothetical protein